ncbi:hypothetical protein E2C01_098017 [Portunus trituberculatus]|uniref:Uncharacterized protein n=1 Tax=Portunus trituberculatus TaxID=210409 RepID=A0A5B7K754_PORTR|nr:hypothetical protein [Portunus trituberculatus]
MGGTGRKTTSFSG